MVLMPVQCHSVIKFFKGRANNWIYMFLQNNLGWQSCNNMVHFLVWLYVSSHHTLNIIYCIQGTVMPTRKLSNSGRQNCLFAKGLEGILGCIHASGFMILWFLLLMLLNVICVPCFICLFNISSYLSRYLVMNIMFHDSFAFFMLFVFITSLIAVELRF